MSRYVPNNTHPGSLYDFLLQQMAAESYFETPDTYSTPGAVKDTLTRGTNRIGYTETSMPFNDGYPGLTRMTDSQADEFVRKFRIVHQWSDNPAISADPNLSGKRPTTANDAGYLELNGQQILANTGLSATLMAKLDSNRQPTNEYTLAIRSTEFRPWAKG